jgi:glycosyltransferase involved in cell wall biosynthesis
MKKVIHLVPSEVIGGVEIAAKSVSHNSSSEINFDVKYVSNVEDRNNPLKIITTIGVLLKANPDILITSLWRACVVGLLVKLINKKIKFVVFLHSEKNANIIEYFITSMALLLANEVWSDSGISILNRLKWFKYKKTRIISFKIKNINVATRSVPRPFFVYWGRISKEKDIDHSLRIFHKIHSCYLSSKFMIIGPDSGARKELIELCDDLGLAESVVFAGSLSFAEIAELASQYCFYLQTSVYEGAAMSVMEAMQLGLIPVVTPVGEITSYCMDGKNAIIVKDDKKAINDILYLLENDQIYKSIYYEVIATMKEKPLYSDSILAACAELV